MARRRGDKATTARFEAARRASCLVFCCRDSEVEKVNSYGPNPTGPDGEGENAGYRHYTVGEVADRLVKGFGTPGEEGTLEAMDLVVFKGDRIMAVVRRGADGRPEVTTFAEPT